MIIKRWLNVFLGTLTACLLLCSQGALAAPPEAPAPTGRAAGTAEKGTVSLDFKDIELADLIQTISELTGKNFLYDETVKGKVTIISPDSMSLEEAYQLFLTVLNVKGFTTVPSGSINKIIPLRIAKETNLPTITGRGRSTEQVVTRLIQLQNIDATEIANTVLAPLIPKTSNIVAYPSTNTLIITDSAANIERLVEIIRELDVPTDLDLLAVLRLEYADAEEVAKIATQILTETAATPRRRGRVAANVQAAGGKELSKVLPYPRTNTLVVMASAEDLVTIKSLIAELDREPSSERSHINVYYLEHADAETLATTLNEILTGIRAQVPRTGRQAQPPGQPQPATENVSITADKPTNSLIINSTPEDYDIIKGIISSLDIKRKQVFVEALILELSMDATKQLGASLQGAVATGSDSVIFGTSNLNTGPAGIASLAPASGSTVPTLLTQTIDGILLGGLFSPITVTGPDGSEITVPALSALIDLSKTDSDINILSAPRLLTSDNEEAEIIIGSNVPIITSRLTDSGSTGLAQSVSVERQDVALTLRFTPQITEGNQVRLNVYQEITDISQTSVGDVNQVGPTLTKRLLRNTVLAENGRTVVLGGLISSNTQQRISKVPLLGDIPLLGWLFKRKSNAERKTNLLVFITPQIIKDASDLAQATQRARGAMERFRDREMSRALKSEILDTDLLQFDMENN
ncbi:type II secretion system secretin GspD [Desulfuromonas sp. TF]|uniref:type II secretion system secretin GspD n=1 Tax=Desulfuromonas sp. TF TaxID=1232410 RepID=UPI0004275560|nr:type II secretion system secretin GspD [Desulfuromonas sp. TF]